MRVSETATVLCLGAVVAAAVLTATAVDASAVDASARTIKGTIQASGLRRPADIVVFLRQVPGDFAAPAKPVAMDQKDLVFEPHVLPVVRGTTVDFPNSEVKIQHNVFSPDAVAGRFNLGTYPPGQSRQYVFNQTCEGDKTCVVTVLCHVHPEMSAYVLILQNPYFAVTDRRGQFEIRGVPPGEYELVAWHEKLRELVQPVRVASDAPELTLAMRR